MPDSLLPGDETTGLLQHAFVLGMGKVHQHECNECMRHAVHGALQLQLTSGLWTADQRPLISPLTSGQWAEMWLRCG